MDGGLSGTTPIIRLQPKVSGHPGDGNNYTPLDLSRLSWIHVGLHIELAPVLVPMVDFSIRGSNFSNGLVVQGDRNQLTLHLQSVWQLRVSFVFHNLWKYESNGP